MRFVNLYNYVSKPQALSETCGMRCKTVAFATATQTTSGNVQELMSGEWQPPAGAGDLSYPGGVELIKQVCLEPRNEFTPCCGSKMTAGGDEVFDLDGLE